MNCDVFLQWMKTHAGQGMPENPEVIDHLESCPACRQLFSLDVCLESAIQQAFTPSTCRRAWLKPLKTAWINSIIPTHPWIYRDMPNRHP